MVDSIRLARLALALYNKHGSGGKVARRLHVSKWHAYKLIREAGGKLPHRHSPEVNERKKILKGETAAAAVADYAAGVPMIKLKRKYHVGQWALLTAVKDAGIDLRKRGAQVSRIPENMRLEMIRLYVEDRFSQVQVAARFGRSQTVVSGILVAAGISIRGNKASGSRHSNWKGGRTKHMSGYWSVNIHKDDPYACMRSETGYVLEHRLVMAKSLGRPLYRHETVHHINGVRTDNRLENLQLRVGNHGFGAAMKCLNCGSQNISFVPLMFN